MLCCIQVLFMAQRLCSSSRNTKRSLLVKLWELKDKQLKSQSPCRDWQDTTDPCGENCVMALELSHRIHYKRVIVLFFFVLLYLSVFRTLLCGLILYACSVTIRTQARAHTGTSKYSHSECARQRTCSLTTLFKNVYESIKWKEKWRE